MESYSHAENKGYACERWSVLTVKESLLSLAGFISILTYSKTLPFHSGHTACSLSACLLFPILFPFMSPLFAVTQMFWLFSPICTSFHLFPFLPIPYGPLLFCTHLPSLSEFPMALAFLPLWLAQYREGWLRASLASKGIIPGTWDWSGWCILRQKSSLFLSYWNAQMLTSTLLWKSSNLQLLLPSKSSRTIN